jgi:hypothetical protein
MRRPAKAIAEAERGYAERRGHEGVAAVPAQWHSDNHPIALVQTQQELLSWGYSRGFCWFSPMARNGAGA